MLGIVILNYNTWRETISCIESIKKHVKELTYKIYLVDNNSPIRPDFEIESYINNISQVEVIYSKENRGYSAGNNIGIKKALEDDCDSIMICNSDIIFVDNSIEIMHEYIKKNKTVGIVGPQIYNLQDEFEPFHMMTKLTAVGKIQNMFLKTPFKFMFRSFENKFYRSEPLEKPIKVFGAIGCCFLMSSECAKYLYPLDENTFLYEEEYIIGVIMEKSSFEVHIIPKTHVRHMHGASTKEMSQFAYKCLVESEQYYLKEYLQTNWILCKIIYLIRKAKFVFMKKK